MKTYHSCKRKTENHKDANLSKFMYMLIIPIRIKKIFCFCSMLQALGSKLFKLYKYKIIKKLFFKNNNE